MDGPRRLGFLQVVHELESGRWLDGRLAAGAVRMLMPAPISAQRVLEPLRQRPHGFSQDSDARHCSRLRIDIARCPSAAKALQLMDVCRSLPTRMRARLVTTTAYRTAV